MTNINYISINDNLLDSNENLYSSELMLYVLLKFKRNTKTYLVDSGSCKISINMILDENLQKLSSKKPVLDALLRLKNKNVIVCDSLNENTKPSDLLHISFTSCDINDYTLFSHETVEYLLHNFSQFELNVFCYLCKRIKAKFKTETDNDFKFKTLISIKDTAKITNISAKSINRIIFNLKQNFQNIIKISSGQLVCSSFGSNEPYNANHISNAYEIIPRVVADDKIIF